MTAEQSTVLGPAIAASPATTAQGVLFGIVRGLEKWLAEERTLPTRADRRGALTSTDLAPLEHALELIAHAAHRGRLVDVVVTTRHLQRVFEQRKWRTRWTDTFSNWSRRIGEHGTRPTQQVDEQWTLRIGIEKTRRRQGERRVHVELLDPSGLDLTASMEREEISFDEAAQRVPLLTPAAEWMLRNSHTILAKENPALAERFAVFLARETGVRVRSWFGWMLFPIAALLALFAMGPTSARAAVIDTVERVILRLERLFSQRGLEQAARELTRRTEDGKRAAAVMTVDARTGDRGLMWQDPQRGTHGWTTTIGDLENHEKDLQELVNRFVDRPLEVDKVRRVLPSQLLLVNVEPRTAGIFIYPEQPLPGGGLVDLQHLTMNAGHTHATDTPWNVDCVVRAPGQSYGVDPHVLSFGAEGPKLHYYVTGFDFTGSGTYDVEIRIQPKGGGPVTLLRPRLRVDDDGKVRRVD